MPRLIIDPDSDKPTVHYYDSQGEAKKAAKKLRKSGKKVSIQ